MTPTVLAQGPRARQALVLVAGNPNSGKSTVFNALSGARTRVGNYPGVTIERRSAVVSLHEGASIELTDLPGTYSLSARSREEQIAVESCSGGVLAAPMPSSWWPTRRPWPGPST
jgi:ferrous iron transport protein B